MMILIFVLGALVIVSLLTKLFSGKKAIQQTQLNPDYSP
jgi:hypothetical protein